MWDRAKHSEKKIYLTFDDGPIPEVTDFVLEALKEYQAKATFFCVGDNVLKHPWLLKKIYMEGHTIGNHTQHHLNGWSTRDEDYLRDVNICNESILRVCAEGRSNLFRPPYGRIRRKQIQLIRNEYKVVMWDVLSGDFDKELPSEKCLQKSLKYSKSGSIVIFHDSWKAEGNLKYVLPRFLDHFKNSGFKFEAL